MRPLTPKQKTFVSEYLIDLNATQAAIRAGYSAKTSGWIGQQLLAKTHIAEKIHEAIKRREERTEINADYVLKRLVEIDQMDCIDILTETGGVKPVSEWPKIWRQFISGFEVADMFDGHGDERELVGLLKKIKWPDKVKNLELIGRHVRVQAFPSKVEVTGKDGQPLIPTRPEEMTDEQLAAIASTSSATSA